MERDIFASKTQISPLFFSFRNFKELNPVFCRKNVYLPENKNKTTWKESFTGCFFQFLPSFLATA